MIWLSKTICNSGYIIYSLTQEGHQQPAFIWYCKTSSAATLSDAMKNPDFNPNVNYMLQVIEHCPNKLTAQQKTSAILKATGLPPLNKTQWINRFSPVLCVTTGIKYKSAAEAAEMLQINRSQLSQHLRRNPGYKSIRNMVFTNISSAENPQPDTAVKLQRQLPDFANITLPATPGKTDWSNE